MEDCKEIAKVTEKGAVCNNSVKMTTCAFCKTPPDDKRLGKFFLSKTHQFGVHQYCMFFSAGLPQNGSDNEGFEGFLENDIIKEINRTKRLLCCFCHKNGASAGCCAPHCKKSFHFPCGESKKFLYQFFGQFRSYCKRHRPYQTSTSSLQTKYTSCSICLEDVPCQVSHDTLITPCCRDTWFHRSCVQKQAIVSGYFFRCAVCNNVEEFKREMHKMGIFIPDRDAAWEDGSFAELYEKYNRCDAPSCTCPRGRSYSNESGFWEMLLCKSCGQYGTHLGCNTWDSYPPSLLCPTCRPVYVESETNTRTTKRKAPPKSGKPFATLDLPGKSCGIPRKTNEHSQRKRARYEKAGISVILTGRKRHASDDFQGVHLISDTKSSSQRTLAASTTATSQNDMPPTHSDNLECKQGPVASDATKDGASDDDCVITKYVPGCPVCPKCNRRKAMKTIMKRPTVSETPRRNPSITSAGPSSAMTSPKKSPMTSSLMTSMTSPKKSPMTSSLMTSMTSPKKSPMTSSLMTSMTSPKKSPMTSSLMTSMTSPKKSPMTSSLMTSMTSPKKSPMTPSLMTSMTSPQVQGGAREIRELGNSKLSRAPFMERLGSKSNAPTSNPTQSADVKGFEMIERAARSIDKSSVLLLPCSNERGDETSSKTVSDVPPSSRMTTYKKDSKSLLTVEDVVKNVASDHTTSHATTTPVSSFFTSSVQKIVHFFHLTSSETSREKSDGSAWSLHDASLHESNIVSIQSHETKIVKTSSNLASAFSAVNQRFQKRESNSNNIERFPPYLPAIQRKQTSLLGHQVTGQDSSVSKGEVGPSGTAAQSKTCYAFPKPNSAPRSDTELMIDRAYECKNSEQDVDRQRLKSCS